ncbi:MAG: hypothetical protein D6741_08055 [Planctomycetota bacterium]|nr:MAG: hypothetical protein D6741_08055 [Planctomycetota bacterium]
MRVCADCGRPMRHGSCRRCYGTRAVIVDEEAGVGVDLDDLVPPEDDYSEESDADSVYREREW